MLEREVEREREKEEREKGRGGDERNAYHIIENNLCNTICMSQCHHTSDPHTLLMKENKIK